MAQQRGQKARLIALSAEKSNSTSNYPRKRWLALAFLFLVQIFLLFRWSKISATLALVDHQPASYDPKYGRLITVDNSFTGLVRQAVQFMVGNLLLPSRKLLLVEWSKFVHFSTACHNASTFPSSARENCGNISNISEVPYKSQQVGSNARDGQESTEISMGWENKLLEREKKLESLHAALMAQISSLRDTMQDVTSSDRKANLQYNPGQVVNVPKADSQGNGKLLAKCRRQKDVGRKGKVRWRPEAGKYLLVMCSGGQLSNRISCIRQHMLDAALLNRTLVLPSRGIDYNYENLLDLKAPSTCFGNNTFLTLDEFLHGQESKALEVDVMICHIHKHHTKRVCDYIAQRYGEVNIKFKRTIIADLRTQGPWHKYKSKDFIAKFTFSDKIVAFGNMFGVGGADFRFRGSAPLVVSAECKYYLAPSPHILKMAAGFVNSFLGNNFMALHLRRGDFYQHCSRPGAKGKRPCFHPLQQIASCLARRLDENPTVKMVYLSTNADELEIETLRAMLVLLRKNVLLVRMPELRNQPWAEPVLKLDLQNDTDVISFTEKAICVLSKVFYGTYGSTFTGDILRLRDWLMTNSCSDAMICPEDEAADLVPYPM